MAAQRGRSGQPRSRADRGPAGRAASPRGFSPPGAGTDLRALRERLRALLAPVVAGVGYDLEDLQVSRVGRRHLLRITVDGDAGVDLDAVAAVSREISAALDEAEAAAGDLFAGEYQLEVSSPGIDRPLTEPRHWRRNIGRLVAVTVRGGHALTARVVGADEDGVVLDADGTSHELPYDQLGPGRVQVEFARLDEVRDEDLTEIDDEEGGDDE
jgi:ribosome maturation factor RimP